MALKYNGKKREFYVSEAAQILSANIGVNANKLRLRIYYYIKVKAIDYRHSPKGIKIPLESMEYLYNRWKKEKRK